MPLGKKAIIPPRGPRHFTPAVFPCVRCPHPAVRREFGLSVGRRCGRYHVVPSGNGAGLLSRKGNIINRTWGTLLTKRAPRPDHPGRRPRKQSTRRDKTNPPPASRAQTDVELPGLSRVGGPTRRENQDRSSRDLVHVCSLGLEGLVCMGGAPPPAWGTAPCHNGAGHRQGGWGKPPWVKREGQHLCTHMPAHACTNGRARTEPPA